MRRTRRKKKKKKRSRAAAGAAASAAARWANGQAFSLCWVYFPQPFGVFRNYKSYRKGPL
jgi:hypothetical protein